MATRRFKFIFLQLSFLLFIQSVFAQFTDNFNDGDFTANPLWSGNTAQFMINTGKQLQLNGTSADTVFLYTQNQKVQNAEWQFWMKLNFNPSTQNFVKIYLSSDNSDLNGSLNGYFIRIGENLSLDGIDLFRQNGNAVTSLINGIDAHGAIAPVLRIKVIHRSNGDWELYSDTTGNNNFKPEGTANDNSISSSSYFGVVCGFTSSNSKNFLFDDFYSGDIIVDTFPPKLNSVSVTDSSTLRIRFNEALDPVSASVNSNYFINNNIGTPVSATWISAQNEVELKTAKPLLNNTSYSLKVSSVKDIHNNTMGADSISFYTFFPVAGSIVINELFPDPTPVVGLPEAEFLEIFNTIQNPVPVLCSGWQLSDGNTAVKIPDFMLNGNDYIIFCNPSDTSKFSSYGKVIGVQNIQTLNNDGDKIILLSADGKIIDEVSYDLSWYHDKIKQDGGWSIERINPYLPCSDATNWEASVNPDGGTPAKQNSVYSNLPDKTAPYLEELSVIDTLHLQLTFNKKMDQAAIANVTNYTINPAGIHPLSASALSDQRSVQLSLATSIKKGTIYYLSVKNISDCSGNLIKTSETKFGLPETADSLDLIINEILFNPFPNGYDFVEIYNRSQKIISLKNIKICSFDTSGKIKTPYSFSAKSDLIFPKEYAAVSSNRQDISDRYTVRYPEKLLEISSMPSFIDASGVVGILNNSDQIIDKFNYSESYHFKLLDNSEGVSLERISPDYKTQDPANWTSASSSVGFATPTYQNSHYQSEIPASDEITIDPQTFSPDNDGFQDELMIRLKFDRANYFGSITIFDLSGREVRKLVKNDLFGDDNLYKWDGTDNNGSKAAIGVYIILFEISNTDGTSKKVKKTCTLAAK